MTVGDKSNVIYTGKYKGIQHSKDAPVWAENIFNGNPPEWFESWEEWVSYSTKQGLFKGVKIEAIPC